MVFFWIILTCMLLLAMAVFVIPAIQANKNLLKQFSFWSVFAGFAMMAVIFYTYWGNSQGVTTLLHQKQQRMLVDQALQEFKNPDAIIARMEAHLADDPNSAEGWYLLGRLYLSVNRYAKAQVAFEKANYLQPDDPKILLSYVQALIVQPTLQNLQKAHIFADTVLKKVPDNQEALNLLALIYYREKKYDQAIEIWEGLLTQFSPESEEAQALMRVIQMAQSARKRTK